MSGVASPTPCDDETMAVALEALLIPTDVRDHSGRSVDCALNSVRLKLSEIASVVAVAALKFIKCFSA